jgi:hypothetical protein
MLLFDSAFQKHDILSPTKERRTISLGVEIQLLRRSEIPASFEIIAAVVDKMTSVELPLT